MRNRLGRALATVAFASSLGALLAAGSLLVAGRSVASGPTPADLRAACDAGAPFLAVANLQGVKSPLGALRPYEADAPAVLLFSDTPANRPQYALATIEQVGAVFGLAYREADESVYAAAYHKVQLPFGPGGPGAIYRIDLDSGAVTTALVVPYAGEDHHEANMLKDSDAGPWTSRTSLGDIDLNGDGSELYVTNLNNRRIYRFALPSGQLLGSFAHGAVAEPWAASARPFGLAWHAGHLYHGVVDSAETSGHIEDLRAVVYRSQPDGSDMEQVADFGLAYRRGRLRWPTSSQSDELLWRPWRDNYAPASHTNALMSVYPMPLLTDLDFDAKGDLVVGLRDRHSDDIAHFRTDYGPIRDPVGFGVGDLLFGTHSAEGWQIETAPEHFDDGQSGLGDESAHGGLAELPDDITVAGTYLVEQYTAFSGATWFANGDGRKRSAERLGVNQDVEGFRAALLQPPRALAHDETGPSIVCGIGALGDVEVLCAPDVVNKATSTSAPTASATSTPRPGATATASRQPTSTTAATGTPTTTAPPSRTATPGPRRAYLPLALGEICDPAHKRADVVLVMDTSSSMAGQKLADAKAAASAFVGMMDLAPGRDQVAVVRYDTEAALACHLTDARAVIEAAIRNLTTRNGTHIDAGLRLALDELRSARHLERNMSVMVLLTDGIQTGTPGEEARAAAEVRAAGVRLYTVGLGTDADTTALLEMAGDATRYRFAPSSADLAGIYAEIARDIACPAPAGGFWPGRG